MHLLAFQYLKIYREITFLEWNNYKYEQKKVLCPLKFAVYSASTQNTCSYKQIELHINNYRSNNLAE
jgi:hypothetical protein